MRLMHATLVFSFALCCHADSDRQGKKRVQDYLEDVSEVETCDFRSADEPGICADGSVSFRQPADPAFGEGTCGPTAVANVSASLCRSPVRPREVAAFLRRDGTNAAHLLEALNGYVRRVDGCRSLVWKRVSPSNGVRWSGQNNKTLAWLVSPYEEQPRDRLPAIVGLRVHPDIKGHWTTVIAVEVSQGKCEVRHNTWGRQFTTPCHQFDWLMRNGDDALYLAQWRS